MLSACVSNVIAHGVQQLLAHRSKQNTGPSSTRMSRAGRRPDGAHSPFGLHIEKLSELQDYVCALCRQCDSLIQSSIVQVQAISSMSSTSSKTFLHYSELLQGITLQDLQAFDLSDMESSDAAAERVDLMIRVCAADVMFLRLFDVFDHHSPLIPPSLHRVPGAGGIPFLNFPELRLRRLCERVHLNKLTKYVLKQLNEPGQLQLKFDASYERIRAAGLFADDEERVMRHLLQPRKDMGGNCIVGKLTDGVASEQLQAVADSICRKIRSAQYLQLLEQLLYAQFPIEFGIRLRLLIEPLSSILQASSNKEFGADDIIPLTDFVFSFVFAPRAMESADAYRYWVAKLCIFKEMLNDELAQSYLQEATGLIHAHTAQLAQHHVIFGEDIRLLPPDIDAVKNFIQQLKSERAEGVSPAHASPFQGPSSDDDLDLDAEEDAMAEPDDSLSASQLAALALSPRSRNLGILAVNGEAAEQMGNAQFKELMRSCIKRNGLLQQMHHANLIKNHSQLYKVVEDCLCASEAIDWMVGLKYADSRQDAIRIGKLMVADGFISNVDHNKPFQDKPLLFRILRSVLFESQLIITGGFFQHPRHFAIHGQMGNSNFFTLCWYRDKDRSEVRGEIRIFSSSIIKRADELGIQLSVVEETKKGYGVYTEDKCFSLQASTKQMRDRWFDELTQVQKRLAVSASPDSDPVSPGLSVDVSMNPSEVTRSLDGEAAAAAASPGDAHGGLPLQLSRPVDAPPTALPPARQQAAIEADHVFYRGAHMSFNDFLLTALSESEWCVWP